MVGSDLFEALVAETTTLADEFKQAGKTLYLVGGIVRDTLLGRLHADLDIDLTTDAEPDEIEAIVRKSRPLAVWTQGKRFGTVGAMIPGSNGPRAFEITTHRAEQYQNDSRKPDVRFSTDVTLDLSRRDFTANAMAYDLHRLALLDPFGGQHDLFLRVLRTPLSPEISFSDDPLRMLRAARFLASLHLHPDPAVAEAVHIHRHRMAIVSGERIRGELEKLLTLVDPADGVRFLAATALLETFLPEIVPSHIERILLRMANVENEWPIRFAAFVFDAFPSDVTVRQRMRQLKCSGDEESFVMKLLQLRTVDLLEAGSTDRHARRFVRRVGDQRPAFMALMSADARARNALGDPTAEATLTDLAALEDWLRSLAGSEPLDDLQPELSGVDVMALLGLPPGRHVGEALRMLLELRLDEGLVGRAEAERRLLAWSELRSTDGP